jgi:glycosyltransferase involved in cell wall biosynthesis
MNVALLVPEMPPDAVGGGGPVFLALATQLAARGHTVDVIAGATYRGPKDQAPPENFRLLRVPEFPHPSPAYRTSMPPMPTAAFFEAIRRLRNADVINAHGYAFPLIDTLGTFVDRKRVVFTLHGFLFTIPQQGGPIAAAYRVYDNVLGNQLLKRAPIVTAVSTAVKTQAANNGRTGVRVITNGFTPATPTDLTERVAAEANRGAFLLCIGRIQWLKGFDIALQALQILRNRGHNLRLLIAGRNADYEEQLRQQIQEKNLSEDVSLLGQVPSSELATLLKRSTAFLMPSRTEAFPATPLEAMAAGTPAILSNVGGVPDIATNNVNALLAESENPESFANAIERLLNDNGLRNVLIQNGYERAKDFNWPKITEHYEATYEEILRKQKA